MLGCSELSGRVEIWGVGFRRKICCATSAGLLVHLQASPAILSNGSVPVMTSRVCISVCVCVCAPVLA